MLPRFGAAPAVRFVSSVISRRLRHVGSSHRSRVVAALTQPSSSQLTQKRYGSVEVFGPFDPPKQLTFKEVWGFEEIIGLSRGFRLRREF